MPARQPKAVCYKCHFIGWEASLTRCPTCHFPVIIEWGEVDADGPSVEDIFDRTSVGVGAPPLPGVDGRPRKAQLLAQARARRRAESRQPADSPAVARRGSTIERAASRRALLFAFVSAILAGTAAAALQAGVL